MRKRSGQVHSRESSATLQLTVSLLYHLQIIVLLKSGIWYNHIKFRNNKMCNCMRNCIGFLTKAMKVSKMFLENWEPLEETTRNNQ